MLELDRLSVHLGATTLLREVSLMLGAGEFLGVVGPNGAGKSTLVRAIAGLVSHGGTVRVGGCERRDVGARSWARLVAYVPQRPVLPPGMTVTDYVLLGRSAHHGYLSAETRRDRQVATAVLERLELRAFASRALEALSGGEAQRVVLARALAQEAPLLVLDEPTAALDLGHSQLVLQIAAELRAEHGLAVLCTLHDLTLASRYADSLVLLHGGEAAVAGPPDAVVTEANLARYFGADVEVLAGRDGPVVAPLAPQGPATAWSGSRLTSIDGRSSRD